MSLVRATDAPRSGVLDSGAQSAGADAVVDARRG